VAPNIGNREKMIWYLAWRDDGRYGQDFWAQQGVDSSNRILRLGRWELRRLSGSQCNKSRINQSIMIMRRMTAIIIERRSGAVMLSINESLWSSFISRFDDRGQPTGGSFQGELRENAPIGITFSNCRW
jgi:hypothetical protein